MLGSDSPPLAQRHSRSQSWPHCPTSQTGIESMRWWPVTSLPPLSLTFRSVCVPVARVAEAGVRPDTPPALVPLLVLEQKVRHNISWKFCRSLTSWLSSSTTRENLIVLLYCIFSSNWSPSQKIDKLPLKFFALQAKIVGKHGRIMAQQSAIENWHA